MTSPRGAARFLKGRGWRYSTSTRDARAGRGLMAGPINYFVYELKRKLTAEKAGTYAWAPRLSKGRLSTARKEAITRPGDWSRSLPWCRSRFATCPRRGPRHSAVESATYRLAASASPTSLRVGDPLTLTLDIERGPASGSLDLISAPDLAATQQLAADFEILDKNPTGRKERELKAIRVWSATEAGGSRHSCTGCHRVRSRYRKVLGDHDRADRPRCLGGQSPGCCRPGRIGRRLRDIGDQVAGAGDFSKHHRPVGTT